MIREEATVWMAVGREVARVSDPRRQVKDLPYVERPYLQTSGLS
jgi:hypothetical protein